MKKFYLLIFLRSGAAVGRGIGGVFLPHDVSGRFPMIMTDSGFVGNQRRPSTWCGPAAADLPQLELRCPADTFRVMVIGDCVPRGRA
jgi:hypothetical protein